MKRIAIFAGMLLFASSFFANATVQFVKADILEDVVINYNNISSQVEVLVAQEVEGRRQRIAAAERLDCLLMIERYKIKLLYIDGELERKDYSGYSRKYYGLFKLLNDWKYGL